MSKALHIIRDSKGLAYGYEWDLDAFDHHINNLLLKANAPNTLHGNLPRIAIDIGCGTGNRAANLAALEIFDRVIAVDIADRTKQIAVRNRYVAASNRTTRRAPIKFMQASVLDLTAEQFSGSRVAFINFRNVAHFLAPAHLCQAISIIQSLASEGTLLAMSFDKPAVMTDPISLHDSVNPKHFYVDSSRGQSNKATNKGYSEIQIKNHMKSQNFKILPDDYDERSFGRISETDCRNNECRIAALIL